MKKIILLIFAVLPICLMAQKATTVSGTVVDEKGLPLAGATIFVPGTTQGTVSDMDGKFFFKLSGDANEVQVTYIGYEDQTKSIEKGKANNFGSITLKSNSVSLDDIIVSQSVAVQRKTPVAVSSITSEIIEEKLGTKEFPEILKSTPGVYATKQGGGFGDSRINMRGFEAANVAVVINGVPINDMEWGGTYWSNWQGLADVTRSIQTQRGLGASKISSPSVGGSINIVTKSLDATKGGSVSYGIGNDNSNQISFSLSTGLTENGWALTILGGKKWGDGYIQGTPYESYNYFVNVAKRLGTKHQLSFTAFGAPQWHYQRSSYDGLSIKGWQEVQKYMGDDSAYKYNATNGFGKNGIRKSSAFNRYHKPLFTINHQWQITPTSSLSTAVYASIASGYGMRGMGNVVNDTDANKNLSTSLSSDWYGSSSGKLNTKYRNADGSFAYDKIQTMNEQSATGSAMAMSKSVNDHQWYGLLSTYTNQITNNLELSLGIDARYYIGTHTNELTDLFNGAYYIDYTTRNGVSSAFNSAAADPNWKYEKLSVGDVVYRDYDSHIVQEGGFAQLEYSNEALTAFVSGSISNNTNWRYGRFYYDEAHAKSAVVNCLGYTGKGGVNYNISANHNVFANVGYISRAPFFSGGVFLYSTTSNVTNPDPVNEKIMSFELGYGFHSKYLTLNLNAYYTKWMDKTMSNNVKDQSGAISGYMNASGIDALHKGIEVDLVANPTHWMSINAMCSLGDWKWDSDGEGYWYNLSGQPMAADKSVASGVGAEDHAKSTITLKGIHVGNSAQTTAAVGVNFKPMKSLRIGFDYNIYARNFANYSISTPSIGGTVNIAEPWQMPVGGQLDMSASYRFKLGGLDAALFGNVDNILNQYYITDATSNSGTSDWMGAYVLYSFGRTYSLKLKVNF